jgi:hypothetical protein
MGRSVLAVTNDFFCWVWRYLGSWVQNFQGFGQELTLALKRTCSYFRLGLGFEFEWKLTSVVIRA